MLTEPSRTNFDLHFRLFGCPVRVHPFFWLGAVILGSNLATGDQALALMLSWIGIVFLSILVHEFGHALVMAYFGERPRIVLYAFGGLAISDQPASSWGGARGGRSTSQQVLVSAAGPGAGFLLAVGVFGVSVALGGKLNWSLSEFPIFWQIDFPDSMGFLARVAVYELLFVNVFWGLINLLPVLPLDGGQIARAVLVHADPWQGFKRALWLSVFVSGMMAVYAFYIQSMLMGLLFISLGVSSYLTLQQSSGGGRPW